MRETFEAIDVDDSGWISLDELKEAFKSLGNLNVDIQKIMEELDWDKNGEINYTEFMTASLDKGLCLSKQNLWSAFKHFDTDNSGQITKDDLKEVFRRTGRAVSEVELNKMLYEERISNDQGIEFSRFCNIMGVQAEK